MYCVGLYRQSDAAAELLVGSEARVLPALTYGTTFRETKRTHGPLPQGKTVQDALDYIRDLWNPSSLRLRQL